METYMTNTEKVLKILRECGEKGCHSFELNQKVGTTRSAARIVDLKKQGYNILSKPERLGEALGVRYFLTKEPLQVNTKNRPFKWVFEGNVARREYL